MTVRDRNRTTEALLSSASNLFAQKGYDGASVAEIAAGANVSVALINRYFGGKAGLLDALIRSFVSEVQSAKLDYPPASNLENESLGYLRFRLRVDQNNEQILRLAIYRLSTEETSEFSRKMTLDAKNNVEIYNRMIRLQEKRLIRDGTDIENILSLLSNFSFSSNFFGAILDSRSRDELDRQLQFCAQTIAAAYGT